LPAIRFLRSCVYPLKSATVAAFQAMAVNVQQG
jgi:hypothetical protein